MSWHAVLAFSAVAGALGAMAAARVSPARALGGALAVLVIAGVVNPATALRGFANEAVATIALLFLIAAAVRRSGALGGLTRAVLGNARRPALLQLRLAAPVAAASAFLNNTPIVAMLTPEIGDWARRHGVAASRLLIPLSYAAILGGLCTLIGTSTNLVVDGMLRAAGRGELGMFDLTPVGLPAAAAGILVIVLGARHLLPVRDPVSGQDAGAFIAELVVEDGAELCGRALGDGLLAGGRALTPVEIRRGDRRLPAPSPDEILAAGDRLVVTAPLAELVAVEHLPGLVLAGGGESERDAGDELGMAVVTARSPLVGAAVGDGSFRRRYGAAVVGVQRGGVELEAGPLSTWRLEAGDCLLLAAGRDFGERPEVRAELVLLSSETVRAGDGRLGQLGVAALLIAMVAVAALGVLDISRAALAAVVVLLATGRLRFRELREDIDWPVLAAIASALGLGAALTETGAADFIATGLVSLGDGSPRWTLAAVYLGTVLLTEIVTNNAAAAIMLPIALTCADGLGVSWHPFAITIAIAASASFLTPVGYQTNLIVYGAGGYRFTDFLRLGLPVTVAVSVVTLILAPIAWPF